MIASAQQHYVKAYSRDFGRHICREVFETKEFLSGQDLLTLTPVQQVNYFVLKVLYRVWQQEMLHMESPYFDHQQPAVRKALHAFMNTLSQHIHIGEEALEPLLEQACEDTLMLMFWPRDFFYQELVAAPVALSATYLRNTQKYLRVNVHVLTAFVVKFNEEGVEEISPQRAEELLQDCEAELAASESIEAHLSEFAAILPLPEELLPVPDPLQAKLDSSEKLSEQSLGLSEPPTEEQPSSKKTPKEKPISSAVPKLVSRPAAAATPKATPTKTKTNEKTALSGRSFSHISQTQAEDFIRMLFNNKQQLFVQALKEVADSKNFDAAVDMLLQRYGKPQRWNMEENPYVKKLFLQVFRFFRGPERGGEPPRKKAP